MSLFFFFSLFNLPCYLVKPNNVADKSVMLVGSLDPYLDGSMALYNVCDADTAYIFDTAKGHTLPREKTLVKELGDTLRNMMAQVQ